MLDQFQPKLIEVGSDLIRNHPEYPGLTQTLEMEHQISGIFKLGFPFYDSPVNIAEDNPETRGNHL